MVSATPLASLSTESSTTLNGTNSYDDIKCYAWSRGLYKPDCFKAINQLPVDKAGDPSPAYFSLDSRNPRFRLPQKKAVGSCVASVELTNLISEASTWATIRRMMGFVYQKCVVNGPPRGGHFSWGEYHGLKIALRAGAFSSQEDDLTTMENATMEIDTESIGTETS